MVGGAYVLESGRPSAPRISHPPILHVPARNACLVERIAEVARVAEIVLGSPVAAMYEEQDRMRALARRHAEIDKLVRVGSVRRAQVGVWSLTSEDVLFRHGNQYTQAYTCQL